MATRMRIPGVGVDATFVTGDDLANVIRRVDPNAVGLKFVRASWGSEVLTPSRGGDPLVSVQMQALHRMVDALYRRAPDGSLVPLRTTAPEYLRSIMGKVVAYDAHREPGRTHRFRIVYDPQARAWKITELNGVPVDRLRELARRTREAVLKAIRRIVRDAVPEANDFLFGADSDVQLLMPTIEISPDTEGVETTAGTLVLPFDPIWQVLTLRAVRFDFRDQRQGVGGSVDRPTYLALWISHHLAHTLRDQLLARYEPEEVTDAVVRRQPLLANVLRIDLNDPHDYLWEVLARATYNAMAPSLRRVVPVEPLGEGRRREAPAAVPGTACRKRGRRRTR